MFSSFKQGRRNRGGRSSRWHQKLRDAYNENCHCFYCGIKTIIENRNDGGNVDQVPNAATLDHIYSNLDLRRLLKGGDKVVLSCFKCNNKRSAAECRKVFPNSYDMRNNRIRLTELLQVGEPDIKVKLSQFIPLTKFSQDAKRPSYFYTNRQLTLKNNI